MQGLAIRTAKRLNRLWGCKGKVFHERFHGRDLKTPKEVRGVLEYLMHNARRHGYRLAVEGPDPYSSGRWFDGWRGWRADTLWAAPLARVRAWIVAHGWRRLGLIETRARPPWRLGYSLLMGWSEACRAGVAAALLWSCGDGGPSALPPELARARPSGVQVLLIGVDGATFNVIEPLLEQGALPVLAGLMERGSHARLRSESPMKSPAIWTTVATGHAREVHGIDDFTSRERGTGAEPAMVATVDRRTLALWNILTAFELESTVVGWWVTWPAEPILGRIVSDRLAQSRWVSWTGAEREQRVTFPEDLARELSGLVVDPLDPPLAELEALVELSDAERAELLAAEEPIPFHGPSVLKFGYCEQRTYENVACELLGRRQGDLALVFLIAVDPISHTFWHFFEPAAFGQGVDPAEAARLGRVVPAIYEHNDRAIGRLLELVDEDTVVLIVSDHGFRASGELPVATRTADLSVFGIDEQRPLERPVNVGMTGVHKENGVLVAAGGPILAGAVFETQPTVADIAPTVLALLGLPVASDLAGRVLVEMIDPEFLRAHPLQSIASYEGLIERPELAAGAQQDGLRQSYLKALGYTD